MAEQTLYAGRNVSLMTVRDGLIRRSKDIRTGENYAAENNGYEQDQKG
jgi:hypothetical protein